MSAPAFRDRPPRTIEVDGRDIRVKVRESRRARTTRILVGPQRPLEVIVAASTADDEIDRLLASRATWITEKLRAVEIEQQRPAQLGLDRQGVLWLAGDPLVIDVRTRPRALARLEDRRIIVAGPDQRARQSAVERWYRREARARIRDATARHAERLALSYRSVGVRDQRTRWGSCSRSGNLSFNWRLVVAPADVLDYVVTHELCHRAVPNHSKAFWRQLEAAFPGWQRQAAWLRENGGELRRYAPRVP
jgi:predicted metal-dependent hydrolase